MQFIMTYNKLRTIESTPPPPTAPPRCELVVNVIPAETSDALPVTTTTTDRRTLELPPRDSIVSGTHNDS